MRHSRTKEGAAIHLETQAEETLWKGERFTSMQYRISARAAARRAARGLVNRGMRLTVVGRNGAMLEDTTL